MKKKNIPYPWVRRFNFVQTSILPKVIYKIYRFNVFPNKIPADFFFIETDKLILKFIWQIKRLLRQL